MFSSTTINTFLLILSAIPNTIIDATKQQQQSGNGMLIFANNQINGNSLAIEVDITTNVHQLANMILQDPQCGISGIKSNQLIISLTDQDIPFDNYQSPLSDLSICAESVVEFRADPKYHLNFINLILHESTSDEYNTTSLDVTLIPPIPIGQDNFLQVIKHRTIDWLLQYQQETGSQLSFEPRSTPIAVTLRSVPHNQTYGGEHRDYKTRDDINVIFATEDYIIDKCAEVDVARRIVSENCDDIAIDQLGDSPAYGELLRPMTLIMLFYGQSVSTATFWVDEYASFDQFIQVIVLLPIDTTLSFE